MKYTRSKLHEFSPRTDKTASGGVFGLHANRDVSTYNETALVQIVLCLATKKQDMSPLQQFLLHGHHLGFGHDLPLQGVKYFHGDHQVLIGFSMCQLHPTGAKLRLI